MPTRPRAHLVLVQPGLALGFLKAALDPPALARNPHQLGQHRLLRRTGEIERELMRAALLAADQQTCFPARHRRRAVWQIAPIVQPWALGPIAGTQPFPAPGRHVLKPILDGLEPE